MLPQPQQELSYERLRLLLEINNAVVTTLDLHELIHTISEALRDVIPHDFTALAIYDEETKELRAHATEETDGQKGLMAEGTPLPMDGTFAGVAITRRQTLVREKIDFEEFHAPMVRQGCERLGLRSACVVPLMLHERILGGVTLWSKTEGAFSEEHAHLLEQIAGQLAIAVDNALNFQHAQQERDRRQLLLEVSNAVVSNLSLKELLLAVSGWLRKFFAHDWASMVIKDEESGQLRVHALNAPAPGGVLGEGSILPLDGTPPGLAMATRQTVMRDRIDFEEFYSPIIREAYNAGLRSGCSVPLISHDQVLGTINVGSLSEAAFTRKDAELLEQIAKQVAIAVENSLAFRELAALKNKLVGEKLYLEEEIQTEYNFEEIIGRSASLKKILQQVKTVAPTDSAVLLCGETGTGKELIARAIHSLSNRRERTLVKLNCAAIPTGLLESELFGHEKGAFTGAIAQRIGRFELANKGTLLLDEVGEIPLDLQPKLLRVLQEHEFERLGSSRTIRTDARMIAATNVDLPQMVAEKKFRSDLFYRLNVFPITIPPLRERVDDIPLLIGYFTQKHALRMNKRVDKIPRDTVDALCSYPWPGNVRELENFMERSVILSSGVELQAPLGELQASATTTIPVSAPAPGPRSLEDVERRHIQEILEQTRGVIGGKGGAAEILGLPTSTLRNRMKKLGLK